MMISLGFEGGGMIDAQVCVLCVCDMTHSYGTCGSSIRDLFICFRINIM